MIRATYLEPVRKTVMGLKKLLKEKERKKWESQGYKPVNFGIF